MVKKSTFRDGAPPSPSAPWNSVRPAMKSIRAEPTLYAFEQVVRSAARPAAVPMTAPMTRFALVWVWLTISRAVCAYQRRGSRGYAESSLAECSRNVDCGDGQHCSINVISSRPAVVEFLCKQNEGEVIGAGDCTADEDCQSGSCCPVNGYQRSGFLSECLSHSRGLRWGWL